jgi:hypothetical protein
VDRFELESELVGSVLFHVYIFLLITGADLRWDLWWPPVWAGSYWTSSLQYRALVAGARLSHTIGRYYDTLGYDKIAPLVLDYLQESRPFPLVMDPCAETWVYYTVLLER